MRIFTLTFLLLLFGFVIKAQEDTSPKDSIQENTSSLDNLENTLPDSLTIPTDTLAKGKKKKEKKEKEKKVKAEKVKLPPDTIPRPTLGIGIGLVAFNGDVKSNENVNLPLSGGLGAQFTISQVLTPNFTGNLSLLFSQISANERSTDRNLNFQTRLFTGGVNFFYNFKNFFPGYRSVVPYIGIGIEYISFSTKTDLIDEFGNEYHYWSDGTIRNVDENSPDAEESILLQRDYVYETDIRSEEYAGSLNYDEYALGIPVTIGADIALTSKVDFGFSWAYHFTNTDDIDGVNSSTPSSVIGNRSPNGRNDHFWFLSASLKYNLTRSATGRMEIRDQWSVEELMAFGEDDYDGDGVYDFYDECPQTPFGIEVNERGCPLNPERPVALTDSQIYERYLAYMDSTGLYTKIEKRAFSSTDRKRFALTMPKKSFKIKLGEFVGGVPLEVQNLLLSIPDVETHKYGDTTIFTVGDYDNLPEAIQRKIQIAIEGFDDAEIVMQDETGRIVGLGDESGNLDVSDVEYTPDYESPFIFRVQLGAFKKEPRKTAFKHVQNLVVVENESGYSKYMSGAFENYVDASQHKIEMLADGWQGAFVVAYKRGQGRRVSMQEAGVTDEVVEQAKAAIAGEEVTPTPKTEPTPVPEFDKSRIKFKIQIGIYKNQVPPDVLSDYMKLNNLAEIEVDQSSAAKRYTSGEFDTYQDAVDYRNKLINKGFETAFIIALKDGELISIEEARKLMGDTP